VKVTRAIAAMVVWMGLGGACRSSEPGPTVGAETVAAPQGTAADVALAASRPAPTEAERAALDRAIARMRAGSEDWYGVYVMGKKVGFGRMGARAPIGDEAMVGAAAIAVVAEVDMEMAVSGGGNANVIAVKERRAYGAAWPHALVLTTFEQGAAGFAEVRRGVAGPDGMRITRTIGGKAEPERTAPATAETLADALRVTPLELDALVVGATGAASTWTWEREADEVLEVTPQRLETHKRAGVEQRVAVIQVKYTKTGVVATTTVNADGVVLQMALGPAIVMKLEEKDVARSGVSGLDVMGSGIPSPEPLGNPSLVERLVFEITTGSPDVTVPDNGHQSVKRLGPERLEVTRVRGPGGAVTDEAAKEALGDDATIDTKSPAIVQHATSLVAGASAPAEKVKIISDWVHANLDKKLATHLPTASKVLEAKVGDCTEHTWLTVALLRAVGVPARPVYGVAYAGDGERSFAYHAWVEVALDGRWLWIDPTWGEPVADATHLQLGEDLGAVAPSLGAMKIERVGR